MTTGDTSEITVIIPTWNGRQLLIRCLDSLARQTEPCTVVVVDDGSSDGTASMLDADYPWVTLIRLDRNRGFAAAVNRGLTEVATPFVALLNNDTEADPNWIKEGLLAFQVHPEISFLASRIICFNDRTSLDSAGDCYGRAGLPTKRGFHQPVDRYLEVEEVVGASAGAAFYRREVFEAIGPLDEGYVMYLEDVDFSLRAQVTGHRCLYVPTAVVYHLEAASDPDRTASAAGYPEAFYSSRRVFWITRNRWQLMVTYQPWRNLPWLAFGWCKSLAFHLFKAGHTSAFIKGLLAGAALSGRALRKRKELKRLRRLSTAELCRLMSQC